MLKHLTRSNLKFAHVDRLLGTTLTNISLIMSASFTALTISMILFDPHLNGQFDLLDPIRCLSFTVCGTILVNWWLGYLSCFALTCVCFVYKSIRLNFEVKSLVSDLKTRGNSMENASIRNQLEAIDTKFDRISAEIALHNSIWSPYIMFNTLGLTLLVSASGMSLRLVWNEYLSQRALFGLVVT